MTTELTPKFYSLLKQGISRETLVRDVLAGVVVGIVAVPLCIAFAIASGVSPDKGLITGLVGGLLIALLGGSRVQIGGPTGAFVIIVYQVVSEHGVVGLTLATLMAGVILVLMGAFRFGRLLSYFPYTVITGFTAGIAVVIFTSQIKELFGLDMGPVPPGFIESWHAYLGHLDSLDPTTAVLGLASVVITLWFPKITRVLPGAVVAIVVVTGAQILFNLPVATIGTQFGDLHFGMPTLGALDINLETLRTLLPAAIAIALLGGIESLLSAVVADGMIGGRHRPNMELVAQGIANMGSALLGGIPATGAIARTATNIKNGGRTPVAGIVHALTLGAVIFLAGPLVARIPLACLAGILVVVAYHMSDLHAVRAIFKTTRHEIAVLAVTFGLTVIFDLVVAIEVGMVLAAFLFVKRMADATTLGESLLLVPEEEEGMKLFEEEIGGSRESVLVYEIQGPLFFGAAQKFFDTLDRIARPSHVCLILRLRSVPLMDATGVRRLQDVVQLMHRRGIAVIICEGKGKVVEQIQAAQAFHDIAISTSFQDALQRAAQTVNAGRTPSGAMPSCAR